MELNRFEEYDVHVLIPQNNESGKSDLKKIWSNYQDKYELILINTNSDAR